LAAGAGPRHADTSSAARLATSRPILLATSNLPSTRTDEEHRVAEQWVSGEKRIELI
jgi:hypothetical protein